MAYYYSIPKGLQDIIILFLVLQGGSFFWPPPNLTKSQALYKLNWSPHLNFLSPKVYNGPGTYANLGGGARKKSHPGEVAPRPHRGQYLYILSCWPMSMSMTSHRGIGIGVFEILENPINWWQRVSSLSWWFIILSFQMGTWRGPGCGAISSSSSFCPPLQYSSPQRFAVAGKLAFDNIYNLGISGDLLEFYY